MSSKLRPRLLILMLIAASTGCATVYDLFGDSEQVERDLVRARQMNKAGPGSSDIVHGLEVKSGTTDSKLAVLLLITRESKLSTCTGVLVSRRVILTAAHCVSKAEPENVKVVFDTHDSKEATAKNIRADKIQIHEKYDGTPQSFSDLALIRLLADAPEAYVPAELAEAGEKLRGDDVVLVGYGITSEEKKDSMRLRKTTKSFKKDIHLKETFLGIEQKSKTGGFCRGDSGAPVFINAGDTKKLYGINSFTVGVEQNTECHTASVAMLVPYFSDWIKANAAAL